MQSWWDVGLPGVGGAETVVSTEVPAGEPGAPCLRHQHLGELCVAEPVGQCAGERAQGLKSCRWAAGRSVTQTGFSGGRALLPGPLGYCSRP